VSCVEVALDRAGAPVRARTRRVDSPAGFVGSASADSATSAARTARRWNNRWWAWLAASAVAYPGGGIVHLLMTLPDED